MALSISELRDRQIFEDVPDIDDFQHWVNRGPIFPGEARYEGARTGAYTNGLFIGPVIHSDVKSMYPSIMIKCNFSPENMKFVGFKPYDPNHYILTPTHIEVPDVTLGKVICIDIKEEDSVSRTMLKELKVRRQEFRDAGNVTGQIGMKLAANSCYGYNGMDWAYYGSYLVAIATCAVGRLVLDTIVQVIDEDPDAAALECDTDGVYSFGKNMKAAFMPKVLALFAAYPPGDDIMVDTKEYAGMICTGNKKNYVLMDKAGKITFVGNSLKGRGMPAVCKSVLKDVAAVMLKGDGTIKEVTDKWLDILPTLEVPSFEMCCDVGKDPSAYDDSTMYAKLLKQAPWMASGEELRYVCVERDGYQYAPLGSMNEDELLKIIDYDYYRSRIIDAVSRLIVPIRGSSDDAEAFCKLYIDKPPRRRKCSICGVTGIEYTKDDDGVITCLECLTI